jgi:hypothetical protein
VRAKFSRSWFKFFFLTSVCLSLFCFKLVLPSDRCEDGLSYFKQQNLSNTLELLVSIFYKRGLLLPR